MNTQNIQISKPLTMAVNETKTKLIQICNESELHISMLDLILENIYMSVHKASEQQSMQDEVAYAQALQEQMLKNEDKETEKESE